jgi:hypothetical protein
VPTDTTGAAPTAGGEGAPEPATGGDADSAEEASGDVDAPDDSTEVADDEPSAHDDDDDERPPAADGERASSSELDQAASAGEPAATDGRSFNDPGEDVLYPANASFAVDDDVAYPLPPGLVPDGDLLEALFGGTGESEVVDLEALFGGLSDSMVAIAPADFDLELMRARGAGRLGSDEATGSGMEPAVPEPQSSDGPGAEEESAQHERVPTVHDLDI